MVVVSVLSTINQAQEVGEYENTQQSGKDDTEHGRSL
jgi:hypothetical protein